LFRYLASPLPVSDFLSEVINLNFVLFIGVLMLLRGISPRGLGYVTHSNS
jgi:hypothetical protein